MYKIFANTLFIGQRLVSVPECHSTNSLASELAAQRDLAEGTVVITLHQTAGRGQRGNTWESAVAMNLTFSIVLKPSFLPIKNQFYLTIVTSLAIADFLKTKPAGEIKIKWPNDVLVSQKKICGILIENSVQGEIVQQSIIGIGLNINQKKFLTPSATSLAAVTNQHFDLNESLNSLMEKIEHRYLQLRSGKLSMLKNEYLENLFGLGEQRPFAAGDRRFDGVIEGLGENGELIVLHNHRREMFTLKEIHFVFD